MEAVVLPNQNRCLTIFSTYSPYPLKGDWPFSNKIYQQKLFLNYMKANLLMNFQRSPLVDGGGTGLIVLGFSGGLDTTYCVKYLSEEKGYEVHSVIVNTGGFSEDELKKIEAHAYRLGVKTHTTVDAVKGYYDRIIKYLIFGNCLKNNTYPLSVSAERLSQALHIAEHVKKLDAKAVAHGSTGAGNDQVRFDMIFHIMIPGVEIITPIRDLKLSREQEIE